MGAVVIVPEFEECLAIAHGHYGVEFELTEGSTKGATRILTLSNGKKRIVLEFTRQTLNGGQHRIECVFRRSLALVV